MNGYSYVDIFDTKGIEYLVVIGFLMIIVPIWIILNKPAKMKINLIKSISGLSAKILKIPRGLLFSKNHTWAYMEESGVAKIGLDDLLLHITGGVSVDYLTKNGEKVNKGDLIARLSQAGRNLNIVSPISGEVEKLNGSLKDSEGKINLDPYGKGWMARIRPENWKQETSDLMMAEEAEKWSNEELLKCKDFMAEAMKEEIGAEDVVLQEGGVLTDFPLAECSPEVWSKFQSEFLD